MQKIKMLRNLLGVQKLGKKSKRETGGLFVDTETTFNAGIIQFVGEELAGRYAVGEKIYFGNQREEIRMGDLDIMVMKEENVFARVEESNEEAAATQAQDASS